MHIRPAADSSRPDPSAQGRLVEQTIDFVDRNYSKPISLRHVASAMGYSACHLTTAFRRATGVPVTAWIIQRRMKEAARLLASSDVSVAVACECAGFHDLGYFTRQFVRHMGMTPGRFRAASGGPAAIDEKIVAVDR